MASPQADTVTAAAAPVYAGRAAPAPAPVPQLALVAGLSSATVGVQATGWRVDNTGAVSAAWAVSATPGEVAFLAGSGTLAAGATVNIGPMALLAGLKSIALTSSTPGAVVTGSPAPFTGVASPPPPAATQLTLSVSPSTGTTGSTTATVTVTPNGPIATTGTASLGLSGGGTLGAATLNFTAGSSAPQSTTLTRSSDGTSSVALTNSMGLTNLGTPATFATTGAAPPPPPPSPPSVPSAGAGAIVRPMDSWVGAAPWTAGVSFAYSEVPSGESIGGAGASLQVDVRNRWPDGSLKFAVVSGVTTAADVAVQRGAAAASGASVAEPSLAAVVTLTNVRNSAGTVLHATLTADIAAARSAGAGAWGRTQPRRVRQILGPVMSEFHYFVPTADDHTSVWFYVRAYSNGTSSVRVVVQNSWTQVAAPGQRTYNAAISVGGSSVYTASDIAQYHHTRVDPPVLDGPGRRDGAGQSAPARHVTGAPGRT
jgi:hypothetical protein